MKVSDYIAELLVENDIKDVFSVVGGGAMHLNDSFGNHPGLNCTYNHHEQASAIAAEGYARVDNKMAVVCVTTGPGGTNAITGVLCAWQDNIPMLVISGQVRYETTVESTGLNLRQFGEQEHYIVDTVKSMTKYAVTIKRPEDIKYHIKKAIYLARDGRRGPCWVDVPLDVQGAQINPDELRDYVPPTETPLKAADIADIKDVLENAKRPVMLAGSAIRTAELYGTFRKLADKLNIPVLVATAICDLFPIYHPLYFGNFGVLGGRTGNFIIQNSDCLLVLGCRLSFKQIGFNFSTFAPKAKKIVVDIDADELKKPTVQIDYPIKTDLKAFIKVLSDEDTNFAELDKHWLKYCRLLKEKFPIFLNKHRTSDCVNPYYFAEEIKKHVGKRAITVVGNSCACDCVRQCGVNKEGQRMWGNTNCGTMGYALPASIGASVAAKSNVLCITGDGDMQMNLQELQTIVYNKLPVKIFVHSNNGYFAIEQTQEIFFGRLSGCNPDSGISMPSFKRLAYTYNIPYFLCRKHRELEKILPVVMKKPGYCICEIIQDKTQPIEPRSKSKMLPGGRMVSSNFDDLFPFLEKDEYELYSDYEKLMEKYCEENNHQ
ncbi:thiamine pyrophosphate-binding protein [Thermodesulfobacteriota bacterium]